MQVKISLINDVKKSFCSSTICFLNASIIYKTLLHNCTIQFKTIQTGQELFSAALVMNFGEVVLRCIPLSHLLYGFLNPVIIMDTHEV